MKKILLSLLFCSALVAFGQSDTTKTKRERKPFAKNFGLMGGVNYSVVSLESSPFFVKGQDKLGTSSAQSGFGISGGIFGLFRINRTLMFRMMAEANITQAKINYDLVDHEEFSFVFPVTVEVPISIVYSRNIAGAYVADQRRWPEISAGIRPVVPLTIFQDLQPRMKTFNLNVDLGVGLPFRLSKTTLRTELLFSYGLLNLIGEDEEHSKTYSISYIGRSFAGLRLYFN
jgi:hypothetical protein